MLMDESISTSRTEDLAMDLKEKYTIMDIIADNPMKESMCLPF